MLIKFWNGRKIELSRSEVDAFNKYFEGDNSSYHDLLTLFAYGFMLGRESHPLIEEWPEPHGNS